MTRIRAIAPLLVLALAAGAGCSEEDGARPAATVNGIDITSQDVVDELESIAANETYLDQIQAQTPVLGEEEGTFDTNFVAQVLGVRIQFALVESELEARDVEITDACTDAATDAITQQVGGPTVFDAFDADYQGYLVRRFAELVALQSDLAGYPCVIEDDEDLLQGYFDDHADEFETELCFTPIQVSTPEAAESVEAALAAGGDYDDVAEAQSELPAETQCAPESTIAANVPQLGELATGERTIAVPLQGTFFFFRLDERQEPSFENNRDDVVAAIGQEVDTAFQDWFTTALDEATVTVDPRYGTWDPVGAQITRPVEE